MPRKYLSTPSGSVLDNFHLLKDTLNILFRNKGIFIRESVSYYFKGVGKISLLFKKASVEVYCGQYLKI